jgi:hypothetical protein
MSNLVEIAKDLEYVPDEELIQLANGSDPRFPPFVVISEIKRRTDMRSRASEPMPKTTVAQEMVQEFAMPSRQGLEGMSQDATGILPPTVYNRDMPSSNMADGGLTSYQTGNQTALTDTFIYGDDYANNLQDFLDMKRKTRTMDQREQALQGSDVSAYPMLSTTPDFDMDMSGISALTPTQTDLDSTLVMQKPEDRLEFLTNTGTSEFISESKTLNYLQKQLEEAKENLRKQKARGDRGGLGGGTSYIEQAQARVDRLQKQIDPRVNRKNFVVDTQSLLKESEGERREDLAKAIKVQEDKEIADTKEAARLAVEEAEKKKFANMDLNLPERTQKPRTEAQMKQQLNADVLMTLGTAIGSSATPSEIFSKLSGLPAQLSATRREQRKEVKDFEDTRRADALAKLNIQINLKKLDQATEQAKLKGDANDVAAINALADVLSGTLDTDSSRYKDAERALDSIIAKLSGGNTNTQGIAGLSELLIPAES